MGRTQTRPSREDVPKLLNECQRSLAAHKRCARAMVALRRDDSDAFLIDICKYLQHILPVFKREPSVERLIKFIAQMAVAREENSSEMDDGFVELILTFLADMSTAKDRGVRFRSCQLIAEILMGLDEEADLSEEVYSTLMKTMQSRLRDKLPVVRAQAARALSRLQDADAAAAGKDPIATAFMQLLQADRNKDVRKNVIASLEANAASLHVVIERTRDVSEQVRKVAYLFLAEKARMRNLSVAQRCLVLRRGLAERDPSVRAAFTAKLLQGWLTRCCGGDPCRLLAAIDAEAHESVAESLLVEARVQGWLDHAQPWGKGEGGAEGVGAGGEEEGGEPRLGLRQFITPAEEGGDGSQGERCRVMSGEAALTWRVLIERLSEEAAVAGGDAAARSYGPAALVAVAVARERGGDLEALLPECAQDYVELVAAHARAGSDSLFAARQLLLLGRTLDFTDATGRRHTAALVRRLMEDADIAAEMPEPAADKWVAALVKLCHCVHGSGQLAAQEVMGVVAALRDACEDMTAPEAIWGGTGSSRATPESGAAQREARLRSQCVRLVAQLLEGGKRSPRQAISTPAMSQGEALNSVILPAVQHVIPHIRKAGVRCLGLLCLADEATALAHVTLLRAALTSDAPDVRREAAQALLDLALVHHPAKLDARLLLPRPGVGEEDGGEGAGEAISGGVGTPSVEVAACKSEPLVQLLLRGLLQADDADEVADDPSDDGQSGAPPSTGGLRSISAEGLAKLLLFDRVGPLGSTATPANINAGTLSQQPPHKWAPNPNGAGHGGSNGAVSALGGSTGWDDGEQAAAGVLSRLLLAYFDEGNDRCLRLRQCLAVFFGIYAQSSLAHQRVIAAAYLRTLRATCRACEHLPVAAAKRQLARVSSFLMQLLQTPVRIAAPPVENARRRGDGEPATQEVPVYHEPLGVRVACEVLACDRHVGSSSNPGGGTSSGKASALSASYCAVLCKALASLPYQVKASKSGVEEGGERGRHADRARLVECIGRVLSVATESTTKKSLEALHKRLAACASKEEPLGEDALADLQEMFTSHYQELMHPSAARADGGNRDTDTTTLPFLAPTSVADPATATTGRKKAAARRRKSETSSSGDEEELAITTTPAQGPVRGPPVGVASSARPSRRSKVAAIEKITMSARKAPGARRTRRGTGSDDDDDDDGEEGGDDEDVDKAEHGDEAEGDKEEGQQRRGGSSRHPGSKRGQGLKADKAEEEDEGSGTEGEEESEDGSSEDESEDDGDDDGSDFDAEAELDEKRNEKQHKSSKGSSAEPAREAAVTAAAAKRSASTKQAAMRGKAQPRSVGKARAARRRAQHIIDDDDDEGEEDVAEDEKENCAGTPAVFVTPASCGGSKKRRSLCSGQKRLSGAMAAELRMPFEETQVEED
eukprot:jgi/Mesvir1/178/Mv13533-RA.2